MQFHLGKPILVMLVVSLASAAIIARRAGPKPAELDLWVFADAHYKAIEPLCKKYEQMHGVRVNLSIVTMRAMNVRLGSLFMTNPTSDDLPDLVELEIGSIGRYFRAPKEDVGFLPLDDYLHKSGWYDRILEQRYAPWTKEGTVFGVPHDVHPTTITYRHDLFWGVERPDGTIDGPRIDLPSAKTWPEFQEKCLQFRDYWKGRVDYRHAIELPEAAVDYLMVMLLQRGINLVDDYNHIHLTNPKVANTVAFYAQLVVGPRKIGGQSTGGTGAFAKDLNDGAICSFITPDWRVTYIKRWSPALSGKMRMMPMPVFESGDPRTGTWGGTMIGITRACKNPDEAWRFIEYIYFSQDGLDSRRNASDVLPPVKELWNDPAYHLPDPYFGGQMANELFIDLARELPKRYVTPASGIAQGELTSVLNKATEYIRERGTTEGLEAQCQLWLDASAARLQARMDHWRFDE
ncbi:MAG: extracellular solute-binding protein [Tepidisphaeraceae bacterium]